MRLAAFAAIAAAGAFAAGCGSRSVVIDREADALYAAARPAMEARRAMGADPFAVSVARQVPGIVDAETGDPVAGPFAWTGRTPKDPMLAAAQGYYPAETPMGSVLEPGAVKLVPRRTALAVVPYESAAELAGLGGQGRVHRSLVEFLKASFAARGIPDRLHVAGESGKLPKEMVAGRATDRFEELLLLGGASMARHAADPVIADDAVPAFETRGAGAEAVRGTADKPLATPAYADGYHLIQGTEGEGAWLVRGLRPGRWAVYLWWDPAVAAGTKAELSFFQEGFGDPTVTWTIDQSKGGAGFHRLGDWVAATAKPILVQIRSADGAPIMADAILFRQLEAFNPISREGERVLEELRKKDAAKK